MAGLRNFTTMGDYSGIDFNTDYGGFNNDYSGLYNQAPNLSGFGSSGGGGGFGNFLNSNFMSNVGGPLLSAGLSGIFTNRAADNYARSAGEAAYLGGQAALLAGREAGAFSFLGEELAQKRRQEDAIFQANLQRWKPFQDLVTRDFGMKIAAQDKPGSEMRAGRFMTMFG